MDNYCCREEYQIEDERLRDQELKDPLLGEPVPLRREARGGFMECTRISKCKMQNAKMKNLHRDHREGTEVTKLAE
jgi:hypothetical protein